MFKILLMAFILAFSSFSQAETIVLEKANTITINGEVNDTSMSSATSTLFKMHKELAKDVPIYLFLNTPGGSIHAGLDFIRFAQSLDREIKTITLRAASMGFVLVQSLGERLILDDGVLMMHRASTSIPGQVPGELANRVEHTKNFILHVEKKMAKRLDISIEAYKNLVHDEFYSLGEQAVKIDAADRVVAVKCGNTLQGTRKEQVKVFVFTFTLEFAECPLATNPLVLDQPKEPATNPEQKTQLEQANEIIKNLYYMKPTLPEVRYIYAK